MRRVLLPLMALLLAGTLALRGREELQFTPRQQQEALHLLASPRARAEAMRAYRRPPPHQVLRTLDPLLGQLDTQNRATLQAAVILYHDTLMRAPLQELDPRGQRRAALVALLPALRQRDVELYLDYLALAARLGHTLPLEEVLHAAGSPPGLEILPAWARALAATGDDRAPELLLEHSPPRKATGRQAHEARVALGRALVSLQDPRGLRLLIDALPLAPTADEGRQVRLELARLTGECDIREVTGWEHWWRAEGLSLDLRLSQGYRPCFAVSPPISVVTCLAFLIYLIIAWVKDQNRWGNFWGVVALTTALYLLLASMVRHNLELAQIPFLPYGDREVSRLLDQVILPYNTLLFLLLTLLHPWRRRARP